MTEGQTMDTEIERSRRERMLETCQRSVLDLADALDLAEAMERFIQTGVSRPTERATPYPMTAEERPLADVFPTLPSPDDIPDVEDVEDIPDAEDVEDVEDIPDAEDVEDVEDIPDVEDVEDVESGPRKKRVAAVKPVGGARPRPAKTGRRAAKPESKLVTGPLPLTGTERIVMEAVEALADRGGKIGIEALAVGLDRTPGAVSFQLNSLKKKGYLRRPAPAGRERKRGWSLLRRADGTPVPRDAPLPAGTTTHVDPDGNTVTRFPPGRAAGTIESANMDGVML